MEGRKKESENPRLVQLRVKTHCAAQWDGFLIFSLCVIPKRKIAPSRGRDFPFDFQNGWVPYVWEVIVDNRQVMTKQHNARAELLLLLLLHGPKNRRPKWTQMISRCLFKQQGFGAGASCRMQMIITSVLWHHGQQLRSLIHVTHFIMWALGILHVPNLWHATQAMANEVCDYRKPEIFLMRQHTKWHDLYVCLLSKSFSLRDMILPCKATDVMCVLLTRGHVRCYIWG